MSATGKSGHGALLPKPQASLALDQALASIAAGARGLDREPHFPHKAFGFLSDAGALASTIGSARGAAPIVAEWELLRRVSAADASVGRILDGHLNAVERLEVAAEEEVRDRELAMVRDHNRLLGVWGADPGQGEGAPARMIEIDGKLVLRGVKTYCSGAGGIDAALVLVGEEGGGSPRLVLVECGEKMEVDRSWYRAAGMRASESHRVVFNDVPIKAILGEPGELGREPWFSRDAIRTAVSWAGMIDSAAEAAIVDLAARRSHEPLAQLAAGRIGVAVATVDAWLAKAAAALEASEEMHALSLQMRVEIDRAAKTVLEQAAAACGSAPFVTGGRLERSRRDLETFLLQHRLDPLLARLGARSLGA